MRLIETGKIKMEKISKDNYEVNFGKVKKREEAKVTFVIDAEDNLISYRTSVSCYSCTESGIEMESYKTLRCYAKYDTGIKGVINRRAYFFFRTKKDQVERLITVHLKGEVE